MLKRAIPAFLLLIGLLAACGLVSVPVSNPLGLDGQKVSLTFTPAGGNQLTPLNTGLGTVNATFGDIDNPPFGPSSYSIELPLALTVEANLTDPPAEITLSNFVFNVTVTDGANSVQFNMDTSPPSIQLTRSNGNYTVTGATSLIVSTSLTSADLQSLLNIITTGGENTVTAAFSVNASPDLNGTLTITFENGTGTVRL